MSDFTFAVVAHLEPEILIVDEVYVGDAEFQKNVWAKCTMSLEKKDEL